MRRVIIAIIGCVALLAANPAWARQQQFSEEQLQLIRQIAQAYAFATYTKKADEACELLSNGQFGALEVFVAEVRKMASSHGLWDDFKRFDKSSIAFGEWKACLSREEKASAWRQIDAGRMLADAIIHAPYNTADKDALKSCSVATKQFSQSLGGWSFASLNIAEKYAEASEKEQFERLRDFFAAQLDMECENGTSQYLRGAYESLLHAEALKLFIERDNPQRRVYTGLGTRLLKDRRFDASELGLWRSRKAFPVSYDVYAYRSTNRRAGKGIWGSLFVDSPGMFGSSGHLFFGNDGRIRAKVSTKVNALKIVDDSGHDYSFAHTVKDDDAVFSTQKFELDASAARRFLDTDPARGFEIHYRVGNNWKRYHGLQNKPASIRIASLLAAKRWASVPYWRHHENPGESK